MTTTNFYQGLSSDKSTSRVSQAPGGGSSNIFGHYADETNREQEQKRQEGTAAVMNSMARAGGDAEGGFQDSRDSFAANRQRNHGEGAPFATNSGETAYSNVDRPAHQQQVVGSDYETPQQRQMANRMRNHGTCAPFAVGDNEPTTQNTSRPAQNQQTIGSDYQTPQQRQANKADFEAKSDEEDNTTADQTAASSQSQNPNKAGNSFSNLFGGTDADNGSAAAAKGKVSTHNPVTWEANSNFDAARDQPQHRSRFESFATTKAGTFNPITGENHDGNSHPSTRVHAPPGGKSSIQF